MMRLSNTTAAATVLVAAAVFFLAPAGALSAEGTVALAVPDTTPPTGAVAGLRSPVAGTLELRLYASDTGLGLANAEASLDEHTTTFVRLGSGACPEHPAPGGPEPPPGACPESVSAVPLPLDTTALPDGPYELRVRATDATANTATLLDRMIEVQSPVAPTGPIATLTIGVASAGGSSGGSVPPSPPGGGLGRCRAPKLKMRLARKPLWHTRPRHVPVLRYGRRYPYKGKLTCLAPSGMRVSASNGTRVGVYYRVWRRSFDRHRGPVKYVRKRTIRVRKKGRLKVKLGFRSGRTLLFRYRAPDGEIAKAKVRVAIPPRTRRAPWGPR